jgi:succinate dehydrogenase assembly factor 1
MKRLSGLQKQVLGLYKSCLKSALGKDRKLGGHEFEDLVKAEFRTNARLIPKSNFARIEFLIRVGKRRLESMSSESVTSARNVDMTQKH